jgi:hypothetical protein
MSVAVPTAACLLIFGSLEAIKELSVLSEVQITKCEITISVCILESIDARASAVTGNFPQLPKYQDFWSISSWICY